MFLVMYNKFNFTESEKFLVQKSKLLISKNNIIIVKGLSKIQTSDH